MAVDVLAVAMLPHVVRGRRDFQFGGSILCESLLRGLAEDGHRVRVIAEGPPGEPAAEAPPGGLGDAEVAWNAVEFFHAGVAPDPAVLDAQSTRLAEHVAGVVAGGPPDVALLGREGLAWYAPAVLADHGIPTALIAQGVPTGGFDAGLYPPDAERELLEHLGRLDLVIAVADHLRATLTARGVERVVTIRNAIDASRFVPRPRDAALCERLRIDPDAPVVAHVSRLIPGKRPLDLVTCAARVIAAEPRTVVLAAGTGEDLDTAQRAAGEHGIAHAFRWLGELEHEELPAILALADVMVHTSEREGAPLTYLEAFACGTPVVATDIAAAREAIAHGETGVLVPLGDVDAMAGAIVALLRDGERRAAMGRAGRAVAEGYDLPAWTSAYAAALGQIADVAGNAAAGDSAVS